ncbi:MAG TPA: acetate kinase [Candidatus Aminicenantes bacterium]|nr:acetate kinase [Candidatus Aminicenantes bacterium]
MKVLVLNSGSSSIKFQLIDVAQETVMAKGLIERVGFSDAIFSYQAPPKEKTKQRRPIPDYQTGIHLIKEALVAPENGVIRDMSQIEAVGHRIVHGGEEFSDAVIINDDVIRSVEKNIELAPLHNPPNLLGIRAARAELPNVPMVGVFDTAFHQTLPERAFVYALPYAYYEEKRIRRFGFHGTSHQYVAQRAAEFLDLELEHLRMITLHLGNGCSITAIDRGNSVDTSLGFGTMCGMPMGTRSGDVDPAILLYLQEQEGYSAADVQRLLYKESGMLGISGISSDMREVEDLAAEGHLRARLALEVFAYAARKYIGAYAAVLGGLDVLVFTAGVGENSPILRKMICRDMEFLGISVDSEKNDFKGQLREISAPSARVRTLVVPTNEELMIAKETFRLVGESA